MPKPILIGSAAPAGTRLAAPHSSAAASRDNMRRAVAMAYPPPGISGHCIKCVVVIASGAKQSPTNCAQGAGDCFVATLLAMTALGRDQSLKAGLTSLASRG